MKDFSAGTIISAAFERGIKNYLPVLVNLFLWIITIWIPYLNVGTTIGITEGMVAKMSHGEAISLAEVFDPQYRKRMGEFFLVNVLMFLGIFAGIIFLIVPGYVIAFSWLLAPLLVVDKNMNPMDAIHKSSTATHGKKWTIFFGLLIVGMSGIFSLGIIIGALTLISDKLGVFGSVLLGIFGFCGYAGFVSIHMAAMSHIYRELAG